MITLTIDGKDFDIIDSYEELSLGQYIDITNLNRQIKEESFRMDLEIVSILSNNREEMSKVLDDLTIDDYNNLMTWFTWVQDQTILDKVKSVKPKDKIEIEGKEYKVISDFNKMSLGEVTSFETLYTEQKNKHEWEQAFVFLLRPIEDGKPVKISMEVIEEVRALKYKVKLMDIFSTISFFLNGGTSSTINNSPRFSIQKKTA